jgi:hypothetical protein
VPISGKAEIGALARPGHDPAHQWLRRMFAEAAVPA